MEKKALPILMFLLIYAPKVGGSLDSMSLFCFLIFLWSVFRRKKFNIPNYIAAPTLKYLFFGAIMLAYALLLFALYGLRDTYQIFRFGRIIINILGILGLVRIYYMYYQENLGRVLLYHLWLCIISHAIIMVLMFLSPAVNSFVLTQLVQLDETNRSFESRMEGNRIGGLTGSWDAASGIQSLGILMLPFILVYAGNSQFKRKLIYLSIPLSLCSIFLSGVTGLVNIAVVGVVFLIFHFRELKKYIFRFAGVMVFIAFIGGIAYNYMMNYHKDLIVETSIGRTLFMITQNEELSENSRRGSTAAETIDKIGSEMYFLPEDDQTFLFGRGGSGRVDYKIKADTGPTLNLHNLGIFFVIILYSYCALIAVKALRSSRTDLYMGMGISAVILTILIIDVKVAYLLARQSLSIMLIAYFSLFWQQRKKTQVEIVQSKL